MSSKQIEADKSIEKIISAALSEFAKKGFEGARVDEIARIASVNKASIYYHIGSKETLYCHVLQRILVGAAQAAEENILKQGPPSEKLRDHIRIVAQNTVFKYDFAPIILREIASGGAHLPQEALNEMSRLIQCMASIVAQGVKEGAFREVNPFAIHMLMVGGLSLYSAGEKIRKRVSEPLGENAGSMALYPVEEMTEQVADILSSALINKCG